jgi:hypothetical protein
MQWSIKRPKLLSALFLFLPAAAGACPLCKEAIEKVSGLSRGFNWSILVMLGTPLAVVLLVCAVLVRMYHPASKS